MENTLYFKDSSLRPDDATIRSALGDGADAYDAFLSFALKEGIELSWNYYRDGKAWLCKLIVKKKNVAWLHVHEGYFKLVLFFTEKNMDAVRLSDIDEKHKREFVEAEHRYKMIPMIFEIRQTKDVEDFARAYCLKRKL